MKKQAIYLLMMPLSFLIWSCSTKSDPTPAATYKFTVNGNTYTEIASSDSTSTTGGKTYNVLGVSGQSADKSATSVVIFFFPGSAKPKAGTYTIAGNLSTTTGNQCGILLTDKVSVAKQGLYSTTGLDGTSVTVAVSSSGKLTVTMPAIAIKGSNFDNTDPHNTVITDVTGSVSGSVAEQ